MSVRSKGREIALQILYQFDLFNEQEIDEAIEHYVSNFLGEGGPLSEASINFAKERLLLFLHHKDEIDEILHRHSRHWKIDRMTTIDRNILRLGALELCFCPDIPPRVVINEALELAKRFGSDESSSFVNGILDGIYKKGIRDARV